MNGRAEAEAEAFLVVSMSIVEGPSVFLSRLEMELEEIGTRFEFL